MDTDKSIMEELNWCQKTLENPHSSPTTKMESLSKLFLNILAKNVNTSVIKLDTDTSDTFQSWVKSSIVNILSDFGDIGDSDTKNKKVLKDLKVSKEFFEFLTLAIKVQPSVLESVCESVLNISIFSNRTGPEVNLEYDNFMAFLVATFDKLRRVPKFVAKFLCSVRDGLKLKLQGSQGSRSKGKFEEEIFTIMFKTCLGPVINLLPVGQVMDLFKTLVHNLEVECVQPMSLGKGDLHTLKFFSVVSEVFQEFLGNIKVADYSIPGSTVEKVGGMMEKVRDCLKTLGDAIVNQDNQEKDIEMTIGFLELVYSWGQLHALLLHYNKNYKVERPFLQGDNPHPNPVDFSYLHQYLDSESWIQITKPLVGNSRGTNLLVKLVTQKVRCIGAFNEENADRKELELKSAAEFIWSNTNSGCSLNLVSEFIPTEKMSELSGNLVQQMCTTVTVNPKELLNQESNPNPKMHYSLILESLAEALKRLQKMKLLTKEIKAMLSSCGSFSPKIRTNLILLAQSANDGHVAKKSKTTVVHTELDALLLATNCIICAQPESSGKEEFSPELIKNVIDFLYNLELESYPKDLKTVVFLCSLIILIALEMNHEDLAKKEVIEITEKTAKIVAASASNSQGNETIFSIKWTELFRWLTFDVKKGFSKGVQKDLCDMVLSNIYVSSKSVGEFEQEFDRMVKEFDEETMESRMGYLGLVVMEFFLNELETVHGKPNSSSKLVSQLSNHAWRLTQSIMTKLDGVSSSSKKIVHSSNWSNFFRACYLSKLGCGINKTTNLGEELESNQSVEYQTTMSKFQMNIPTYAKFALKFIKSYTSSESDPTYDTGLGCVYALKFLHVVIAPTSTPNGAKRLKKLKRKLKGTETDGDIENIDEKSQKPATLTEEDPNSLAKCSGLLAKVWRGCVHRKIWVGGNEKLSKLLPQHFIKDLFEAADTEEFQKISDSVLETINQICNSESSEIEKDTRLLILILNGLVDAELGSVEKKNIRRHLIQECLHQMLSFVAEFGTSGSAESVQSASASIPYIQFQTKIIRRRGAMVNPKALAVCLTSVTAVGLGGIEDSSIFKKVFCTLADLLNAMALHRQDVVAFRSHVFLQCFQYLMEMLGRRADQKNKLEDEAIYNLKHCAHIIERLCQSMKMSQKVFVRGSPYFVAVLIRQFELCTVYPGIKVPLLSGCYKLLDLCDDLGVAQLNSLLTIGSREIFKSVYDNYRKFYEYKGRV